MTGKIHGIWKRHKISRRILLLGVCFIGGSVTAQFTVQNGGFSFGTSSLSDNTEIGGIEDGVGSNLLNCAYIPWGDPNYTETNEVAYLWPNWMVAAFKDGGEWISNPTGHAWKVTGVTVGSVSLHMEVDRAWLTNNAVLIFTVGTGTVASVSLDLYDSNEVVIVSNIWSELLVGLETNTIQTVAIPFESYPGAVGINLRCDTGAVTILDSLLCIDQWGAGSDVLQTDHLDLTAVFSTGGISLVNTSGTLDQSTITIGGQEPDSFPVDITVSNQNSRVGGRIIYVEQKIGRDSWSGLVSTSRANNGPKKTIAAGCAALQSNDTLVIREGDYRENVYFTGSGNVRFEGNVNL